MRRYQHQRDSHHVLAWMRHKDMGRDTHYTYMEHILVVLVARKHILDKKELEDGSVWVDTPDSAQDRAALADSREPAGKPSFAEEEEILGRKVEHRKELADTPALAGEEQTLDKKEEHCRSAMNLAHSQAE